MYDAMTEGDRRWAAIAARDASADGRFYCCVKTTGVYCRPSCAGRPQRKNVVFVATRKEAETAGFRACKRCRPDRLIAGDLAARIGAVDWERVRSALDAEGFAPLGRLLDDADCAEMKARYKDDSQFRSIIVMDRHGFGSGEYKYFADPAPPLVGTLRRDLYARLAPIASAWRSRLGGDAFPASHDAYRKLCAAKGQARPTPLLLSYRAGDYNRLHRDLYGEEVFPIQVAILLSAPGKDFDGGEFVLTEQRPRMQSRAHVVPLEKGDAVAFAVNERPVDGARGVYRAQMRHGVSTVRRGARMTLGVIFHDAV